MRTRQSGIPSDNTPRTEGWNQYLQHARPRGQRCAGLCADGGRGPERIAARPGPVRKPAIPAHRAVVGGRQESVPSAALSAKHDRCCSDTLAEDLVISCVRSRIHRPGPWNRRTSLTPNAITMMSTGTLGTSGTSRVRAARGRWLHSSPPHANAPSAPSGRRGRRRSARSGPERDRSTNTRDSRFADHQKTQGDTDR